MRSMTILLLSGILLMGCSGEKKSGDTNTQAESASELKQKQDQPQADILVKTEQPTEVSENKYATTESGLKYADLVKGNGDQPMPGDQVVVHYTGWLTNGKRFDSSVLRKKPFSFELGANRVIPGWEEGVATMKVGGVRQLILPPELAYGKRGAGEVIPPNSTLIFEVQLVDIRK